MKYIITLITFIPVLAFSECVKGDCQNGFGIYVYADGDTYRGEFKNSARHGDGTYIWADGTVYQGEYSNGEKHGQGTLTDIDGDYWSGNWKNGFFQDDSSEEENYDYELLELGLDLLFYGLFY